MENTNNTTIPNISTNQPFESSINSPSPNQNIFKYLFIICFIVLVVTIISFIFILYNKNSKQILTEQNNNLSQSSSTSIPTEVINEVTPTISENTNIPKDWKTYTDKILGVSFKYPSSVTLKNDDTVVQVPTIKIEINKFSDLANKISDSNFNNKLQQDKSAIEKGDIKIYTGAPDLTDNPAQIIKINNNINARLTTTLQLFDVCSVLLHRKLTFYINDNKVDISYNYDSGSTLIPSKYLTVDKENCSNENIWKDKDGFFNAISNNQLENKTLQNWFNDFDSIINTIKIN